eukprot:2017852-Rhodomonas_salina.1
MQHRDLALLYTAGPRVPGYPCSAAAPRNLEGIALRCTPCTGQQPSSFLATVVLLHTWYPGH